MFRARSRPYDGMPYSDTVRKLEIEEGLLLFCLCTLSASIYNNQLNGSRCRNYGKHTANQNTFYIQ